MKNKQKIKIAIQKSGRLYEDSLNYLKQMGISIPKSDRKLIYSCSNTGADIILARDDDIPALVSSGICDFGIVGLNVLQEAVLSKKVKPLNVLEKLPFSTCRLSIAKQNSDNSRTLPDLTNKKIATSYPAILKNYLDENNIDCEIVYMNGCLEVAPNIGVSNYIFDIVSSGETLRSNDMEEFLTIYESSAVLVGQDNLREKLKQEVA